MKIKANLLKPRWSKVLSDLWDNKLRTLLVVASIAVGVFSVGTIVNAYVILSEDIGVTFAAKNPANIDITTDPFYEDFVRSIEKTPSVLDAEGRQVLKVRARKDGDTWQNIRIIGTKDFQTNNINLISVIEGTSLPDRRELLVSDDFLNSTGFQIGDLIEIEMPDGTTNALPLVGLVSDQATNGGDFMGGASGYVSMGTMEWLGSGDYFNHLYVRVSGDSNNEDHISNIALAIEDKIERNNRQVYRTKIQESNQHPLGSIVLALLGVLGALGALILILSSSLIVNTLNALLTQHLRQIGVMKLVGAKSAQILGMYLILILAYGSIALALALPLSGMTGYTFAKFITGFINAEVLGFRVIPLSIILQIAIALLIPLIAGFVPVNTGSKINVRRAISNDRPGAQSSGANWLSRISEWIKWLSRPILLSFRNTFRRKSRLILTIFTLTIAGAIFIGVFNVRASMDHFMGQIAEHFKADITLGFSQPYPVSRIEQAVLPIPGVVGMEGWGAASIEVLAPDDSVIENINIMGPPADTELVEPDMLAGRWILPGERKALVVSDTIYDIYPDLLPGDTIRVETPDGQDEDWSIVGIFRFSGSIDDTLAYADYDFISSELGMPNQALTYRVVTSEHNIEHQEQVSKTLDKYLRDRNFMVNEVEVGAVTREQSSKAINILIIFLLLMALLTAFVGSIGLTGTMGMNVLERTREIGVMRAIGAVDREIIKSVVIEGGFIGVITWFFAGILSFPISYFLLKIVSEAMMGSPMPLTFTYQGFLIWLLAVLLLSVVASILPARNAVSLTIREVLAYE
ncbi:MAG: ABC transporter permease [Anaerolineales bacterium]|nr:ABC transporter permease [Chloroflexota bacterium]MBL6980457.1 ABC transporter permease [Anaerolineales bacterium]